jgi:RNA polymerase sigma-70 factor (ECF subfamily)
MTDKQIIELFFSRSETALSEIEAKYGAFCRDVALRILNDRRDVEECLNDTWLAAWNAIPPERPKDLGAYLAGVTRNVAVKKLRAHTAEKRGGGETPLVAEELEEVLAGSRSAEDEAVSNELKNALERFYKTLPAKERNIFFGRYFCFYSLPDIAETFHTTENYVKTVLARTRKKLKKFLEKEGLL